MRTIIAILGFFLFAALTNNTANNSWTEQRKVPATITEKWEDWSGEAKHPYKVMFGVVVKDEEGNPTTYYEKDHLGALEWSKVVPGETQRFYSTNLKDLGVKGTPEQVSQRKWGIFWNLWLTLLWPLTVLLMFLHWMEEH